MHAISPPHLVFPSPLSSPQNDEDVTASESMRRMTGTLPTSEDGGGPLDSGGMTKLQYSESIRRWQRVG